VRDNSLPKGAAVSHTEKMGESTNGGTLSGSICPENLFSPSPNLIHGFVE